MSTRLIINGRAVNFRQSRFPAVSTEVLPTAIGVVKPKPSDRVAEGGILYRVIDNVDESWVEVATLRRWLGVTESFIKAQVICGVLDPAMRRGTNVPLVRIVDNKALKSAAEKKGKRK